MKRLLRFRNEFDFRPCTMDKNRNREKCHLCDAEVAASSITDHLFFTHGLHKDEIKKCRAESRIRKILAKTGGEEVPCTECEAKFCTDAGLRSHMKKVHGVDTGGQIPCVVNSCEGKFHTYLLMSIHAQSAHSNLLKGVPAVMERKFRTELEAKEFLQDLTESRCTELCVHSYKTDRTYKKYLVCSRSSEKGINSTPHDDAADHSDIEQNDVKSKKCVDKCTARGEMTFEADGSVSVVVTTGHFGHDMDPSYFKLTNSQTKCVIDMLKSGLTTSEVLLRIKETWPESSRMHRLTIRSIRRLRKKYILKTEAPEQEMGNTSGDTDQNLQSAVKTEMEDAENGTQCGARSELLVQPPGTCRQNGQETDREVINGHSTEKSGPRFLDASPAKEKRDARNNDPQKPNMIMQLTFHNGQVGYRMMRRQTPVDVHTAERIVQYKAAIARQRAQRTVEEVDDREPEWDDRASTSSDMPEGEEATSVQIQRRVQYQDKLALLNREFIKSLQKWTDNCPHYDLTPTVKSYIEHVKRLDEAYTDRAQDSPVRSGESANTPAPHSHRKVLKAKRRTTDSASKTPSAVSASPVVVSSTPALFAPKFRLSDVSSIAPLGENGNGKLKLDTPAPAPAPSGASRKRAIRGGGPLGDAESVVFRGTDKATASSVSSGLSGLPQLPKPTEGFWSTQKKDDEKEKETTEDKEKGDAGSKETEGSPSKPKAAPLFPSLSTFKSSAVPTFEFGKSSSQSSGSGSGTDKPSTVFGGSSSDAAAGAGAAPKLTFGGSTAPGSLTGFTFGNLNSASAPTLTTSTGNSQDANDDEGEYVPPKADIVENAEPGAIYSIKCSLFKYEDKVYTKMGVGMVHIKEADGKKTLLIRACTTLGTLWINSLLNKSVTIARVKDDKLRITVPKSATAISTYVIRVPGKKDADELLALIEKEVK